jgi:hypothetical protein
MLATATAEAVSLLSINRRIQMRQNNVDFQNRELPTNILALLLAREQHQLARCRLDASRYRSTTDDDWRDESSDLALRRLRSDLQLKRGG